MTAIAQAANLQTSHLYYFHTDDPDLVNQQLPDDEAKRCLSKAKNQRLRFFQHCFWECYIGSETLRQGITVTDDAGRAIETITVDEIADTFAKNSPDLPYVVEFLVHTFKSVGRLEIKLVLQAAYKYAAVDTMFANKRESDWNFNVCQEALDFLFMKRQQGLLLKFIAFLMAMNAAKDPHYLDTYRQLGETLVIEGKNQGEFFAFLIKPIIGEIVRMNWLISFQKIDKKEPQIIALHV